MITLVLLARGHAVPLLQLAHGPERGMAVQSGHDDVQADQLEGLAFGPGVFKGVQGLLPAPGGDHFSEGTQHLVQA